MRRRAPEPPEPPPRPGPGRRPSADDSSRTSPTVTSSANSPPLMLRAAVLLCAVVPVAGTPSPPPSVEGATAFLPLQTCSYTYEALSAGFASPRTPGACVTLCTAQRGSYPDIAVATYTGANETSNPGLCSCRTASCWDNPVNVGLSDPTSGLYQLAPVPVLAECVGLVVESNNRCGDGHSRQLAVLLDWIPCH